MGRARSAAVFVPIESLVPWGDLETCFFFKIP